MNRPKLNILVAYPYFSKEIVHTLSRLDHKYYDLIIDSGAFTVWNSNKEIKMDDYCRFLDAVEPILGPFHAVQLDVFGDPHKTVENFKIMIDRGYKVMPVFTRGDTLDVLEYFYTKTDYIMFGGIVIGGQNENYVKWFLENNKERDAHWLGFVNVPFIRAYKPRSVDSSTWSSAGRFGRIGLYVGQCELKDWQKKDFKEAGGFPDDFLKAAKLNGFNKSELLNLQYVRGWSSWSLWHENDIKGTAQFMSTVGHLRRAIDVERQIGTKIYLAVGNNLQLQLILKAYRFLLERGIV